MPVTRGFLAATEYAFPPSAYEAQRRINFIRTCLTSKLSNLLPALPNEILAMIAGLLVHECAVVSAQNQALRETGSGCLPSEFLLDLTSNVYAQFCKIDGVAYIKHMGNSQIRSDGILLLNAQKHGAVRRVFVAQDHLGVRSVRFSNRMPAALPGVWWKEISGQDRLAEVAVTTDVRRLPFRSGQD